MDKYDSNYKGSQTDSATKIILDSQITSAELSVLHEVTAGTAKTNKAVVLNGDKGISGIGALSAVSVAANYLVLSNLTADPDAVTDKKVFYLKNGKIYIRSSAVDIVELKSGSEKITDVTAETQKIVTHTHGTKYPIVDVVNSSDNEVEANIVYDSDTQFTVNFNNAFTGKIISRGV